MNEMKKTLLAALMLLAPAGAHAGEVKDNACRMMSEVARYAVYMRLDGSGTKEQFVATYEAELPRGLLEITAKHPEAAVAIGASFAYVSDHLQAIGDFVFSPEHTTSYAVDTTDEMIREFCLRDIPGWEITPEIKAMDAVGALVE